MLTVAELTAALVRIPTDAPRSTDAAIALCAEVLATNGFRLRRRIEAPAGIATALFERDGDGPPLLIDGHLDVVPAGDPATWSRDPFGGEIADGAVWGRGACDDKGQTACGLIALQRYRGSRRLLVSLCGDEEMDMLGVQALLDDDAVRAATQAIVLEPTNLAPVRAHKGNARIRVDVQGTPGHASRPWLARNAIEDKIALIAAARAWFDAHEGARRLEVYGDEPGTLVVTREETPNAAFNVIPDRASYWYNMRWLPGGGRPQETLPAEICRTAEAVGITAAVTQEYASPPLLTPEDAPLVQTLAAIGGQAPICASYGTHAGHFSTVIAEAVVFGPGDISRVHRADEMITLAELDAGVAAVEEALRRLS